MSATLALSLTLLLAGAGDDKRLVWLGLTADDTVGGLARQSAEDAAASEVPPAAKERGYEVVPLRRVRGLEEQARACDSRACRMKIAGRVSATHILSGHVEERGKLYRVTLILEDAKRGTVVRTLSVDARVLDLRSAVRGATTAVLEAGAPKEDLIRNRLVTTAVSYLRRGRTKDAVRTYQRAIRLNPSHAQAGALQVRVVRALLAAGELSRADLEVRALLDRYGPDSAWAKAQPDDVVRPVVADVGEVLVQVATAQHKKALKLPNKNDTQRAMRQLELNGADALYALYLKRFDDGPRKSEVAHYRAEAAFEEGRYADAAALYDRAAADAENPLRVASALGAVHAHEKALEQARPTLTFDGKVTVPKRKRALPDDVARYVTAVDALVTIAPRNGQAAAFAYRAAHVTLSYGDKEAGKARLAAVVERWPTSEAAKVAKKLARKL